MKHFFLTAPRLIIIFFFLFPFIKISAQYVNAYDKNSNAKTAAERSAEEARNRQTKNVSPKVTPVRTKETGAREKVAIATPAIDYGKYDFIAKADENARRLVKLKGKWGYIDKDEKEVLKLLYNDVSYTGKGWYKILCADRWGFADKNGNVIISCQFDDIINGFNSEGLATVKKDGQTVFINTKGELTTPQNKVYHYHGVMGRYSEGLASVSFKDKDGYEKFGYLDLSGKEIIPLQYDDATSFSNGTASVKLETRWGVIGKNGNVIVPLLYHKPLFFSNNGLASALTYDVSSRKEQYGFIDKSGKIVIPVIYEETGIDFDEGSIKMKLAGYWGFVDSAGTAITPFKYEAAMEFSEGLAGVMRENSQGYDRYGFVNKKGEEIIPIIYQNIYRGFTEGCAGVMLNNYWGFIDHAEKIIVPFIYSDVRPFREGLAAANLKGKWGYVDKNGKVVIPFRYDNTYAEFKNGLISVKLADKWGCINNKGEETIAMLYDDPVNFINGEARVLLSGEAIYINEKGITVATEETENFVRVRKLLPPPEQSIQTGTVENKVYKTTNIGKQIWMTSNLDGSTFRNGEPIQQAKTAKEWTRAGLQHTPAWCYYKFDSASGNKYGKLYNWYAVTDQRGLAPSGMHIPTNDEWARLVKYAGKNDPGTKMKNNTGWRYSFNGTNETMFGGLPGGYINAIGEFTDIDKSGYWWSVTENTAIDSWVRQLVEHSSNIFVHALDKGSGLSIRCIAD